MPNKTAKPPKKPEPIMTTLRRELNKRRGYWPEVASVSGVPYHSLCKIAQGRVTPGVDNAQLLLDYFREHPVDKTKTKTSGRPSIATAV